jgi:glycerol-3-phosphate O-acyltransferase
MNMKEKVSRYKVTVFFLFQNKENSRSFELSAVSAEVASQVAFNSLKKSSTSFDKILKARVKKVPFPIYK